MAIYVELLITQDCPKKKKENRESLKVFFKILKTTKLQKKTIPYQSFVTFRNT